MKNYSVSSKIASCFAGECVGFLVGLASGISRRPALGWPFTISQEERLSYGFGSPRSLGGLVISLRLRCVDGWAFHYSSANGEIASCFAGEYVDFLVRKVSRGVSPSLASHKIVDFYSRSGGNRFGLQIARCSSCTQIKTSPAFWPGWLSGFIQLLPYVLQI